MGSSPIRWPNKRIAFVRRHNLQRHQIILQRNYPSHRFAIIFLGYQLYWMYSLVAGAEAWHDTRISAIFRYEALYFTTWTSISQQSSFCQMPVKEGTMRFGGHEKQEMLLWISQRWHWILSHSIMTFLVFRLPSRSHVVTIRDRICELWDFEWLIVV